MFVVFFHRNPAPYLGLLSKCARYFLKRCARYLMLRPQESVFGSARSTDVLAFSSQGDIAIVECKLAANPEIKRDRSIDKIRAFYCESCGYLELYREKRK
jgi:hypothetical protein